MDSDFVPASTEFRFGVQPKERTKAQEEEYKAILDQVPVLEDVIKHLDKAAKATDSIREAQSVAQAHEISIQEALTALSIVSQLLETEKVTIEAKIKAISKRKR